MSEFTTWRRLQSKSHWLLFLLFSYAIIGSIIRLAAPPPAAVSLSGAARPADHVRFFHDDSWIDENGDRQLEQSVFDAVFELIGRAEHLIVIDMFLFNAWQGPVPETHRALSRDLTQALITRKQNTPDIQIVLISDPINTVYGGLHSPHFQALQLAGVEVVLTRLESLQDSNPAWSGLWRLFIAPWGNSPGSLLPNPFGEGRVSLRSYLALLNFKANHRKLLVADNGNGALTGLVSSANPHDGSSAHRNVALQFSGAAVSDLLTGEIALLAMNEATDVIDIIDQSLKKLGILSVRLPAQFAETSEDGDTLLQSTGTGAQLRVVNESKIRHAVLQMLDSAGKGDAVDLAMFYLSDRKIVKQLARAQRRGASVRVLLDVNSDAFGRQKNGVPNRPVAAELVRAGVSVRWCATQGEQCHAKWLHVRTGSEHAFVLGSANFTRRNLHDYNLETNVLVQAFETDELVKEMTRFFDTQWVNEGGRIFSRPYEDYANDSEWLRLQYRFMEATGLSTF